MLQRLAGLFGEDAPVVEHGRQAAAALARATIDAPAYIVTMVRTPIERNISAWFQNKGKLAADDLDKCMRLFIEEYSHRVPIEWLDRELKKVIGLDVFAEPFGRDLGFRVYDRGRHKLLLFRSDLGRPRQSALVSEFLGREIAVVDINVGVEKPYADEYQAFLNRIELPREHVDWILGSRYARHFWPEETLHRLRRFWLRADASE